MISIVVLLSGQFEHTKTMQCRLHVTREALRSAPIAGSYFAG